MQRHENIYGINAFVRTYKECFRAFQHFVTNKNFMNTLKEARRNPKSKQAKQIMDIVTPVLTIGGKITALGALERNGAVSRIMSMCKRYGMPTIFFTIAIDDVNNLNS